MDFKKAWDNQQGIFACGLQNYYPISDGDTKVIKLILKKQYCNTDLLDRKPVSHLNIY